MNHFSNKLIVKDPFEMPAVDDTTVLVLRECVDLVPHCWIWNESVGYLEVVTYSGYDIYVTVKNVGMKENATSGTIFPSCMEFLITAPNATPIIDNTVTCLRADFKCPTVGQEALMSVDSTSAIRVGDIIIVDTRYQYLVTEIINEHTMKVLNEEKGKEGGVIDVKCNECVPVKILESTHCCEALQDQVDDIYNRIDTKKSIIPDADSLISVTNGSNSLTDAFNDVVLDVDTDLSKYDNATSKFITLSDIPPIPTVNDAALTIYNSDGVTPFVSFSANAATAVTATLPASGNTYTATSPISIDVNNDISISQATSTTDGYLSSTDWNTFNNKSDGLVYFEESLSGTTATFQPKTGTASTFDLGSLSNYYDSEYVKNIYTRELTPGYGNSTIRLRKNLAGTLTALAPYVDSGVTDTIDLGLNDAQFYESWIQYINTYQIKNSYTGLDFIQFPNSSAADHNVVYEAGNVVSNHGHHLFRSGGVDAFLVGHEYNTAYVGIYPSADDSINLGEASYNWKNIYTKYIVLNGTTYNSIPKISIYKTTFDYSPFSGVSNLYGNTYTINTGNITTGSASGGYLKFDCSFLLTRVRYEQTQTNTTALIDTNIQYYLNIIDTTTTSIVNIYEGQIYKGHISQYNVVEEDSYTGTFSDYLSLTSGHSYQIKAYFTINFPGGNQYTKVWLPGGVTQKGSLVLTMFAN